MDLRVARGEQSKEVLRQSFIKLFKTREPEEISVVELCRKAGVNRSTFYAHYQYMDQLILEVLLANVADVCSGFARQLDLPLEDGGVERGVISSYLSSFMENPTLRRFCTCSNNARYRELIIRAQVRISLGTVSDPELYYTAYFQNAGAFYCLLEWLANGRPVTDERLIEIIHEYSKNMYRFRTRFPAARK